MIMPQFRQPQLFEERPDAPAVRLPPEVQGQLRQVLVQWMEALAKMIQEKNAHE
jgi:hypothetical protein